MVKVGEKGQIVIPKKARDIFNIKPGDSLLLVGDEEQGIAIIRNEIVEKFFYGIMKDRNQDQDQDQGDKK